MIPIRLDQTNIILALIGGIFTIILIIFPSSMGITTPIMAGIVLTMFIRTVYLGSKKQRVTTSQQREKSTSPGKLQKAVDLIKSGDKNGARNLLIDIVNSDPNNEAAWLWLASVVSPDKRVFCLEKALSINPNNIQAKQYLEKLKAKSSSTLNNE